MAAVAVLRNETLQAFLQVCAKLSVHSDDFMNFQTPLIYFVDIGLFTQAINCVLRDVSQR